MAQQTYEEITKKLHQGNYAPVYFLMGEEPYYIDQIANYIQEHALDPTAQAFDQTIIYGKETRKPVSDRTEGRRRPRRLLQLGCYLTLLIGVYYGSHSCAPRLA